MSSAMRIIIFPWSISAWWYLENVASLESLENGTLAFTMGKGTLNSRKKFQEMDENHKKKERNSTRRRNSTEFALNHEQVKPPQLLDLHLWTSMNSRIPQLSVWSRNAEIMKILGRINFAWFYFDSNLILIVVWPCFCCFSLRMGIVLPWNVATDKEISLFCCKKFSPENASHKILWMKLAPPGTLTTIFLACVIVSQRQIMRARARCILRAREGVKSVRTPSCLLRLGLRPIYFLHACLCRVWLYCVTG